MKRIKNNQFLKRVLAKTNYEPYLNYKLTSSRLYIGLNGKRENIDIFMIQLI